MSTPPTYARDASGAVTFPLRLIYGVDAIMARLYSRLRTRRGTSVEDAERGLPWLDWLTAPVADSAISSLIRQQALLVPGVVAVLSVTVRRTEAGISVALRVQVRAEGDPVGVALSVADPYQTPSEGLSLWILL